MVLVMRRVPVPIGIAFGVVGVVVVVTAILNSFNGGLGHTPYIAGVWTAIAVAGLAVYYLGRAAVHRIHR
jgi:hypothetical protein